MAQPVIAYVMSRFPHLPETFIVREMTALAAQGWDVRLYPLLLQQQAVVHPDAQRWQAQARTASWLGLDTLSSLAREIALHPLRSGRIVATIMGEYRQRPAELARALVLVPKAMRLAALMRQAGIGHIHAHYATYPALAAWIINQLTGIPYSVTVHAHDIYVSQAMLRRKLSGASFIVAISAFNQRFIEQHCGAAIAARTYVVHCGIRPADYPLAQAPFSGRLEIISTGSLQPYKGFQHLLAAVALLRDRGIDVRCRVIGGGEEDAALRREIAAAALQERFELLGPQPEQRVRELLPTAHCYVQPSIITPEGKMEGIPVALMEALACGLPVVATAISGIPELVEAGVTGILVPPADPLALAVALSAIAADLPAARQLALAGRERVVSSFNLDQSVARLGQLLRASEPHAAATQSWKDTL